MSANKRNIKATKKLTKASVVKSWLSTYFAKIAEQMPDSNGRETQHLPEWMTRKWIFGQFLKDPVIVQEGMC